MENHARIQLLRERLTAALLPESLDIVDESAKHAGHVGAQTGKGHFDVTIVAAAFSGRKPLERHRMVYEALGKAMETDIHALSIRAYAPEEL